MSISLSQRFALIGPLTAAHKRDLEPTLNEWAERGRRITEFGLRKIDPDVPPITTFVPSHPWERAR
ncbi:hypothetical protein [Labrys miyagiensis]